MSDDVIGDDADVDQVGAAHIHTSAKLNTGVEQVRPSHGHHYRPFYCNIDQSVPINQYQKDPHIGILSSLPFKCQKTILLNIKQIISLQYHYCDFI